MRRRPSGFSIFLCVAAVACTIGAAFARGGSAGDGARSQRCADAPSFECSTLKVPLDHRGHAHGTLKLRVAVQDAPATKGVLLFLTGGPGQPGEPFASRVAFRLGGATAGYRLVMFDQRGTGPGALRCPALQAQLGSSDLAPPTRSAVAGCAHAIGAKRRFFSTADTVEDIEALRKALGVAKLTLDGVSYGTYVAERYALRYPQHTARLVLDSVVPHRFADAYYVAGSHAAARVLRAVCRATGCGTDPAADLAVVVRRRAIAVPLLDAIVTMSVADPRFPGVASALDAARRGSWAPLRRLVDRWGPDPQTPYALFSQGLHASTLCADARLPWSPSTPLARRARLLRRAVARIPRRSIWPFTRAIAAGNGIVKTCLLWPPTAAPPRPGAAKLPPVPALLLAGDRDLSTPLAWARDELRRAPRGKLVVVHGAGHSTQLRADADTARAALADFLHHG
jgi:pimeloyl-ACP methyl ester carboxylesterase